MLQKLQDGGTTAAQQVFSGRCDFAPNGEFKAYRSRSLKGLSHEIFRPVFLACMEASTPECEPLLLFKLL
jgi:hypothetical protein